MCRTKAILSLDLSTCQSKALNNDHIDHNEYQMILDEQNQFNRNRESIRTRYNNKIYEEELKEKGRSELRDSLKKIKI